MPTKTYNILFQRLLGFPLTLFFVTDTPAEPALRLVLKIGKTRGQSLAQTDF